MSEPEPTLRSLDELADVLDARRARILQDWRGLAAADPLLDAGSDWSVKQFNDHFPDVLEMLGRALRAWPEVPAALSGGERDLAVAHARTRWLQGYSLHAVIREWGHFNAVVVDHILACDAPGLHRAALAAWARLFNGQQSRSAIEYREIERAEAETRGAELERVLEALRSGSHVRGRAIEALASTMRNDLQVVMTSNALGQDGGHWHEAYQLRKLSRESFLSLEQALSNLVVLAHLEAGSEACRVEDFDAGHGLRQLADALQHLAAPRGVRLEADGPEGLAVAGDPERVRRIARHLLACALQAPAPGTVALRWAVAEPAPTRWHLVVEHDLDATAAGSETGRALALATDAAQQVVGTPPTGRETELAEGCIPVAPGDGVDLLIARHLCDLLGGSLEVEATRSRLRYRVTLPTRYG